MMRQPEVVIQMDLPRRQALATVSPASSLTGRCQTWWRPTLWRPGRSVSGIGAGVPRLSLEWQPESPASAAARTRAEAARILGERIGTPLTGERTEAEEPAGNMSGGAE